MKNMVVFVLILVVIFVLTREFWCWYWKINLRIKQVEQVNENLEQIKALLIYENSTQKTTSNKDREDILPEL